MVQCQVRFGSVLSDPVDFTFLDAAGAARSSDPDELEGGAFDRGGGSESVRAEESIRCSAVKPKRKR